MVITMKDKSVLKLNMNTAVRKIMDWQTNFPASSSVKLKFVSDEKLGQGSTKYFTDSASINIGVYPLSTSLFERYIPIKDSDFVKMGVTFFHEMTHYQNHVSENTNNDIAISDLSVQYNNEYYHAMHHKLPHEIKAEYSGVMSMWSALESEWPDAADRLMFDYLDYRTEKSDRVRKLYMIERPEGGFQSKQQVKDLFNAAYEESLTGKRHLPDTFLTFDDDTSRLLATNDGRGVRIEYVPVYMELLKADTGMDTDQMMASLVSHVHPELQNMYSRIDFEKLEPAKVFESPVPETTDEIRSRLGYKDSFATGVDYITGLQDNEQHL